MISARLITAMDKGMYSLEIPIELQDAWATIENRDALIKVMRQFKTRGGELIDPNVPQPQKRGAGPLRSYQNTRLG